MSDERITPNGELEITHNHDVPGLHAELISDLYSVASSYGCIFPDEPRILRFYSGELETAPPLNLTTITDPIDSNLDRTLLIVGQSDQFPFFLVRTTKGYVMWDQSLTVEETSKSLDEINRKATEVGIYDPVTKKRASIVSEVKPGKMPVSETFSKPGTGFFVAPNQDPLDVLNQFDHPELLAIRELPGGEYSIILRADFEYSSRRESIVKEIFRERGIDGDNPNEVARLSWPAVLEIRDETHRRLNSPI